MGMTVTKPAQAIEVDDYTLITLWPLAIRHTEARDLPPEFGEVYRATFKHLEKQSDTWTCLRDRRHHLRPLGALGDPGLSKEEYAEFVYFYPFVQKFLFGESGGTPEADTLCVFRHRHVTQATVMCQSGGIDALVLDVPRLNLYLFQTGDAVLVAEFQARSKITLAQAMLLNERLRRAYPPFFFDKDGACHPGFAMDAVTWTGLKTGQPQGGTDWNAMSASVMGERRNPMAPWWGAVLPDLSGAGLTWRQVQDDRMPALCSLKTADPAVISRGDWVRLANFDEPHEKPHPYGEAFLADFEATCCYDRFWDPDNGYRTRYLSTGFGMVQVLDTDRFSETLQMHMRTLYFQMALISHFQQAALQNISDQLARAIRKTGGDDVANWQGVARILETMLRFTHAFWFVDVSNQVQARELFAFFRRPLKLDTLYQQVSTEAKDANAHLNRLEDKRAADQAQFFNVMAGTGLVLGVTVGALGMNILIPGSPADMGLPDEAGSLQSMTSAAAWSMALMVLAAVIVGLGSGVLALEHFFKLRRRLIAGSTLLAVGGLLLAAVLLRGT